METIKATKTQNFITVNNVNIHYREAGLKQNPTIIMLHGFPSSSNMYRNIIENLSNDFHIIAPDYPGFGFSDTPTKESFEYTFDNITNVVESFIEKLKIDTFYLMMQDYGGPIGMRIATANPKKIKGLIIQNANIYKAGLGELAQKIGAVMQNNQTEELNSLIHHILSAEGIKEQYITGAPNPEKIDSISYETDAIFMNREGIREVQKALFMNYGTNFPKYPEWQNYLKEQQPKTLVLWGTNDKFFSKPGAEAYKNDLKDVEIHLFDGGHFMLEEYPNEASELIRQFF